MAADHPHLPPGVAPGPQSRRARMGRRAAGCVAPFFVVAAILMAVLCAGAVYVAVSIDGVSGPVRAGVIAFAVLFPLLFLVIALVLWRGAHPRHARGLAATADTQRLRRGQTLTATLAAGGSAELGLLCRIHHDEISRTSDSSSRVTRHTTVWESWTAPGPLGASLVVPADGAPSYEGELVSFAWAVYARMPGDKAASEPFPVWVEP